MNHMKNQISALSDPFPILDDLLKNWFGEKKKKKNWCRRLMAEIFIYNSANVVSCIICILPVSQDYCFLYYQVYDWVSNENKVD